MKVHSYTVVHYGADYISYALRSIYEHVDQAHIIYTPHPSHGHQTDQPPIETRDEIQAAALAYDPERKIRWYDIRNAYYEGKHRDQAVKICKDAGAEMILVVDYDEVWPQSTLKTALSRVAESNFAREWRINFTHLWKSFDYACYDQGWPARILDLRHNDEVAYIPKEFGEIYHFGYAVRDEVMRYKISIHGHKNEMRQDWLEKQWAAWPPAKDCHPTNEEDFWTPVKIDKHELPLIMREHPYYDLERIE